MIDSHVHIGGDEAGFLMNEEMKKNTDLSVLCGSTNNADIILPDFDINNLVYLRKESLLLYKKSLTTNSNTASPKYSNLS